MPKGRMAPLQERTLASVVRVKVEVVVLAFDAIQYQSSYETKLHETLKAALVALDELQTLQQRPRP